MAARPSPFFDSKKPEIEPANPLLTDAERAQIRYLPCASMGAKSELRR